MGSSGKKDEPKSATGAAPDGRAVRRRRAVVRIAFWILLTAGALAFVYDMSDIFGPLLTALALAYMLDPLVAKLQARGWSRRKSVIVIFSASILVILLLAAITIPSIVHDVGSGVRALSGEYNDANWNGILDPNEEASFVDRDGNGTADPGYIVRLDLWMRSSEHLRTLAEWAEREQLPKRALAWAQANAREIATRTFSVGSAGVKALSAAIWELTWWGMTLLLFPIYLYVFMIGLENIQEKTLSIVPTAWRERITSILGEIGMALSGFFRGRLVIMLATAIFTGAAFGILGLKFGVLLGLAIGVASIVPFLNVVFLIPALLIAALEFQSLGMVTLVLALYGVGQLIDPVLSPYLLGRGTGQHPVTVLVSMFVWARLLGGMGLLLSVPLTAAAKVLGREFVLPVLMDDQDTTGEET